MDYANFLNLYPAGVRSVTLTKEGLQELMETGDYFGKVPVSQLSTPEAGVVSLAGVTIYVEQE